MDTSRRGFLGALIAAPVLAKMLPPPSPAASFAPRVIPSSADYLRYDAVYTRALQQYNRDYRQAYAAYEREMAQWQRR